VSTILTDCHNVEDYRDMMATEELYEVNVGDFYRSCPFRRS